MTTSSVHGSYLLPIGIGSALGGVARYLLTAIVNDRASSGFPFGTLAVNVIGCLLIGIFYQLLANRSSDFTQVLLTTGFCGGFTTFSTFSYETVRLMETGLWQRAASYAVLSLALGLGAFWVGGAVVRGAGR